MRSLNAVAAIVVTLCWPVYLALFLRRRKPKSSERKRDPVSLLGICLQAAGVFLAWWHRPLLSSLIPVFPANVAAPLIAIMLAGGAVWFSYLALKILGPQWTLVAEVSGGHRLVREGLYGVVRHPLYLCFFGLTLATGIVWAEPLPLLVGAVVFWCGVWIRVRTEEKLLRQKFGAEFDQYVRQVPAVFPVSARKKKV